MAVVKVHYLRWDEKKEDTELIMKMLMGYEQDSLPYPPGDYRTHEYELDNILCHEDIFKALNADDRPNGQTERSMCVGDIIETEAGELIAVNPLGFVALRRPSIGW